MNLYQKKFEKVQEVISKGSLDEFKKEFFKLKKQKYSPSLVQDRALSQVAYCGRLDLISGIK